MKTNPIVAEHKKKIKEQYEQKLYYTFRSLNGYHDIRYFWLIGARGRGKSYAAVEELCSYAQKYGQENIKAYWFRISDLSVKAMLNNKAKKAIDAMLVRKYDLELTTHANELYNRGKPFITFNALVSAAKVGKGVAEYDPEFLDKRPEGVKRFVFVIIDEFMVDETQEKKSVGDPLSQFRIFMENIFRLQQPLDYDAVKVIGCANSVSECGEWLGRLCGFIPEQPGRYVLKRKHTIVDQIPNSQAYIDKRKTAITADIMDLDDANYTNKIKRDIELLADKHHRYTHIENIIKFSKDPTHWYTLWDGNIIRKYSNQPYSRDKVIAMKRYLDEAYSEELAKSVLQRYDSRAFKYSDLLSLANFASELKIIKGK